nr:cysteine-rich RLK (receptor-like protein kinase) 8 [Tanacetum cinerariifolium]
MLMVLLKDTRPDSSLFTYYKGTYTLIFPIYLDDILLASNNSPLISNIKEQLHQKLTIKDLGPLYYYLGIEFQRNLNGIAITQRKYALDLIEFSNLQNEKPAKRPLDSRIKLTYTDGDPFSDPSNCMSLVGTSLISWHSKKQQVVFMSSTEAKFMALSDCSCEITWLSSLLKDLQVFVSTLKT